MGRLLPSGDLESDVKDSLFCLLLAVAGSPGSGGIETLEGLYLESNVFSADHKKAKIVSQTTGHHDGDSVAAKLASFVGMQGQ